VKAHTPRTDTQVSDVIGFYSCATVPASLSRELERENSSLVESLERCLPWIAKAGEAGAFDGCIRPEGWQKAIEQARAALALAGGGK
jgi:hypothetical protein